MTLSFNPTILFKIKSGNLVECVIAGSKGEGTTSRFESDMDIMSICNIVICADDTAPFHHLPFPYIVLEADRRHTSGTRNAGCQ